MNNIGCIRRIRHHYKVKTLFLSSRTIIIDIKKVDKQLTNAMHVKDRHVNDTFIDKFTKWYQ